MSFSSDDLRHMTRALQAAQRGLYTTDPNPRVGCVLVRDDQVITTGWHEASGGPHAEVAALAQAGDKARGSHAYVTLEPCCHQGKTGPCTQALIDVGVSQVTYAMRDPDPRVAGQGHQALEQAGIEVREGLLAAQARELNIGFVARHQRGRPWLRLKLAVSLDGRIAASDGSSAWITGEAARADVHHWRARSSWILTGSGTVNWDNPRMTVRLPDETAHQPRRAVLSSGFIVDPTAKIFADPASALVIGCADSPGRQALEAAGIQTHQVNAVDGGADLEAALQQLAAQGANEVHAECGPALAGNLLDNGLVDELLIYQADCLLGDQGLPMLKLPGLKTMDDIRRLPVPETRLFGADRRLRYVLTELE